MMPGPNGIITLASDPDVALRAENKTAALALEALSEPRGRRNNWVALHSGQGRRETRQTIQVHLFQTSGRNSQIPNPSHGFYKNSIHRGTTEPHN